MGTLIVDDGIVANAYAAALTQAGFVSNSPEFAAAQERVNALRGRPTLVVLTEVLRDPVVAEESTWAFDDAVLAGSRSVVPTPGADDVLAWLAERNVFAAVTTSFSVDVRKHLLAQLGWEHMFATQLSAHGVRRGHPAPDLLLEAILELRVDSVAQVAIVGDTISDLEAGNRAGAGLVIGVLSGTHDRSQLETAPHTHLVDSVAEVPAILEQPRTGRAPPRIRSVDRPKFRHTEI